MSSEFSNAKADLMNEFARQPEKGHVVIVRITNRRSMSLGFQTEPWGDEGAPLETNASYDIVVQVPDGEYALDIDIEEEGIRVWFISPTRPYGAVYLPGGTLVV